MASCVIFSRRASNSALQLFPFRAVGILCAPGEAIELIDVEMLEDHFQRHVLDNARVPTWRAAGSAAGRWRERWNGDSELGVRRFGSVPISMSASLRILFEQRRLALAGR